MVNNVTQSPFAAYFCCLFHILLHIFKGQLHAFNLTHFIYGLYIRKRWRFNFVDMKFTGYLMDKKKVHRFMNPLGNSKIESRF